MPDSGSFVKLLELAGGSFTLALSGALAPGPLLAAAVREGARQGARAGPLLTLGHGILELAAVGLICGGLGRFLEGDLTFAVLALAGGAVLLAMGIMTVRGAGRAPVAVSVAEGDAAAEAPSGGRSAAMRAVFSGAAVSLSNPYWLLWWLIPGAVYFMFAARWGWPGVAAAFVGHILADLGWYWLVTFVVARGRNFLGGRGHRILLVACGTVLAGFAVAFLGIGALELIRRLG